MKTLKLWKTVFLILAAIGIILLIVNVLTTTESTSVETIMLRPIYLVAALVFFVAAVIMDIIKVVLNDILQVSKTDN